jgi:outer membrane protein assembly factor BamD (BamD/ComL family)
MHMRWIAPSVFVAVSASALAQSTAVLGKSDAAFARRLYDARYADLAEKLCNLLEKSGKVGPDEIVGVKALHLDLRLDLARTEPDLLKRKDLIQAVLQEKEELVKTYRDQKEAIECNNTLPDVYRTLGETISAAILKEKDQAKIVQLQEEGQRSYGQAEERIKQRIEALKESHEDPKLEDQYVAALYNLPRTYYFHSLLYPPGEFRKQQLLEQAIQGFQTFGLDYADRDLNYEGMIYSGLAYRDLGKDEDAIQSFDDAINLKNAYEKDAKGIFTVEQRAADIISEATLQKVLFLTAKNDHAGAIAAAKAYLDTVNGALEGKQGLAVLAALAKAQLAAGDVKGAQDSAERLVKEDDRGSWGAVGRDIQSQLLSGPGSGNVGATEMYKIANSLADKANYERAQQICRQGILATRGLDKEANLGTDGYLLLGTIYARRGWINESALAFDAGADRYPNGDKAPELVYQSLQMYLRLNAEDKEPFYKKRIDERMKTLLQRYPNHPRAAYAQLADGSQLEGEGKFIDAATAYGKIPPGAPSYLEAQFRAGNAYYLQARKLLLQDKKPDEAKPFVTQAETLLKKAAKDIETARDQTMDAEAQARLEKSGFQARAALARMYLTTGIDRPGEVEPVLAGVEEKYGSDPSRISDAWGLRIEALEKLGKLDEAQKQLEGLMKKDPESRVIGPAAGRVARALDAESEKLRAAKKVKEADELQKTAANYYSISGRALLKGESARSSGDIEQIATRLYILGLTFNGVPEDQTSFIGWSQKATRDTSLWTQAADLFEAALKISPSDQTQINLARVLGFLGRWPEAAAVYGQIFDQYQLFDRDTKRLNQDLVRTKKELLPAYLEWGVCEHLAAQKDNDQERFTRAVSILSNMDQALPPDSKMWWQAKYHLIQSNVDRGDYEKAGSILRDAERKTNVLGGPAGLTNEFKALKEEIGKKTFATPPTPPPTPTPPPKSSGTKPK